MREPYEYEISNIDADLIPLAQIEASAEKIGVYTPAVLPGAVTTHEYYTYIAWNISQNPTAPVSTCNSE